MEHIMYKYYRTVGTILLYYDMVCMVWYIVFPRLVLGYYLQKRGTYGDLYPSCILQYHTPCTIHNNGGAKYDAVSPAKVL